VVLDRQVIANGLRQLLETLGLDRKDVPPIGLTGYLERKYGRESEPEKWKPDPAKERVNRAGIKKLKVKRRLDRNASRLPAED
jgi:hypothetical protein